MNAKFGTLSKPAAFCASFVLLAVTGACTVPNDQAPGVGGAVRPVPAPVQSPAPAPAPARSPAPAPTAGATVGRDGSEIRLPALSSRDIEAAGLQGELACDFSAQGQMLLHASGNVASAERAFGIVKIGSYVETVSAAGGFDGILRGATFGGRGTTVQVALGSGPAIGGGESPGRPATLTFERADGASRVFDGTWTCGP